MLPDASVAAVHGVGPRHFATNDAAGLIGGDGCFGRRRNRCDRSYRLWGHGEGGRGTGADAGVAAAARHEEVRHLRLLQCCARKTKRGKGVRDNGL